MDTKLVEAALDTTAKVMVPMLRQHALEHGWPANVALSLTLRHEAGGIHAAAPASAADTILDTEFGTPKGRPKAALAAFFQSQEGIKRQREVALDQLGDIVNAIDKLFA